jgi:hypothetical protein
VWPDRWKLEDLGEELAKAKEEAKEKVGHGEDMELGRSLQDGLIWTLFQRIKKLDW